MARKYLVPIDMTGLEIQNVRAQNLAHTAGQGPASPGAGQFFYNTTANRLYYYNGSTWVAADGSSVPFGTPTVALGSAAAAGSATTAMRSDATIVAFDATNPATLAIGGSAAVGTAAFAARRDHAHAMPAFATPAVVLGTAAAAGSATTLLRSDATIVAFDATNPATLAVGGAAAVGSATVAARRDHAHAMPAFGASTATTSFGLAKADGSGTSIARNDHTHGTPTHDNAAHSAINLSALAAATANISLGSNRITALADPTSATDAATKQYVDGVAQGLDVKLSVRTISRDHFEAPVYNATGGPSGRGQLTSAPLVISGVTLVAGDRVLWAGQTNTPPGPGLASHGIYVVVTPGAAGYNGTWNRASDFDTDAEVTSGAFTFVEAGTYAGTGWVLTTQNPITIGGASGTDLVFTQFSGGGSFVAGSGIDITGNTISVEVDPLTYGIDAWSGGVRLYLGSDGGVARKKHYTIGNGSATQFTIANPITAGQTGFFLVEVFENVAPHRKVEPDIEITGTWGSWNVVVTFAVAPTTNQYLVHVVG